MNSGTRSLLSLLFFFFLPPRCLPQELPKTPSQNPIPTRQNNPTLLTRIAFGSCSKVELEQPLWAPILANSPDLWIWLGDIVYGDSGLEDMARMYQDQKQMAAYQKLLNTSHIIGIWDDHDFGLNNGGWEHTEKAASRELLFSFLDEPADSPRWAHQGAYMDYYFGPQGQQVAVILLDGRYNREAQGPNCDILGEAQWLWLEQVLKTSKAQVHLIGCGFQFLPQEHKYEKWANFPQARARFLKLLNESGAPGIVLLSGDRHIAEISWETQALTYPLYEITSSGMTHSYSGFTGEPNRLRIGEVFAQLNFGLIEINWQDKKMDLEIRDWSNQVVRHQLLSLEDLKSRAAQ